MQMIVLKLIFCGQEIPSLGEISPWLDEPIRPLDEVIGLLKTQNHRRVIKTHLPLDGFPYYPQVKYIVVGRDVRDVFISLWNHYKNYTDRLYEKLNNYPGDPLPRCPNNVHKFWYDWITRGWFEWESDGYPFWSTLNFIQTWWNFRHLPNIIFVHFNDLLKNLEGEIQRIADYLKIKIPANIFPSVVEAVTFSEMKKNAVQINPGETEEYFKGGAKSFFHKGTNGHWKKVLTTDELKLYETAVVRTLSPDCAYWLKQEHHDKSENEK
jgi:aryl sulfotransferase